MKKKYLILIGILLVIFFSMLGIVLFDKNLTFDMSIYNFIISFRCDFLDTLFKAITACGNPLTIVALVVIKSITLNNPLIEIKMLYYFLYQHLIQLF